MLGLTISIVPPTILAFNGNPEVFNLLEPFKVVKTGDVDVVPDDSRNKESLGAVLKNCVPNDGVAGDDPPSTEANVDNAPGFNPP